MELAAPAVLDFGGHGRQTLGPALYVSLGQAEKCKETSVRSLKPSKL